jgi:hypothetical protein
MTEDAETAREMAIACVVARKTFPDESLVQAYLIARFLRDPEIFAKMKRILELVLRRPIGLTKPYSAAEFSDDMEKANRAGEPATILKFPTRTPP